MAARRKLLRLGLLSGAGCLALWVGLAALGRMVADERDEARSGLEARERLVRALASGELGALIGAASERAQVKIDRSRSDPLLACGDCFYREGDAQVLPRLGPRAEIEATPVRDAVLALVEGGPEDRCADPGAPPERRRQAVRELLEHRARYVLPAVQELGSALALVERCSLEGPLARALLREGVDVPGHRRLDGLQAMALRHASALGAADAAFLYQRVLAASRRAGVESESFRRRWSELAAEPLRLPAEVGTATLTASDGATWYLEPTADGVRGVNLRLGSMLAGVARRMQKRSLLAPEDRLELRLPVGAGVAPDRLPLAVVSPAAAGARARIDRRYGIKLSLLALCAGMGAALAVLGVALQRRRFRLLEMKSRFLATVSHELKTPLASMRVLAETLERRTRGLAGARDYPARLLRDIDGMSFLVENILSFNRMTRGRWIPQKAAVSLDEVVRVATDEAREWATRPVEVRADLGNWNVCGDPELLRLLFRNLAVNAVTYNRRSPAEIRVTARHGPGRTLDVIVSDNGVGVAAEDRGQVFDEFYRGAAGAMARGSGLGLHLCRRIMRMHGGTIDIEASGPEGTTLRLRFHEQDPPG